MGIERIPFGSTGHTSSRVIFGAAALGAMKQERADATLAKLDVFGINHIDVAASYGDAELQLAPFLQTRRNDFFWRLRRDCVRRIKQQLSCVTR